MFNDSMDGKLDVGRINFGSITLLTKSQDIVVIQNIRPICLMNTSLNMVTKRMNNKLAPIMEKIIDKSQTAFMQNRCVMEGFSMLHEILHEVDVYERFYSCR
jgi:hypothetical protein